MRSLIARGLAATLCTLVLVQLAAAPDGGFDPPCSQAASANPATIPIAMSATAQRMSFSPHEGNGRF